jgi:hypothetical protein
MAWSVLLRFGDTDVVRDHGRFVCAPVGSRPMIASSYRSWHIQSCRDVAHLVADARQRFEIEAHGD